MAVVERWPELYGKPRLTHIDGETARLISLAADGEHALRESWSTPHYHWTNGKGQLLIDVAAGNTRKMIWDDHLSVHQPHIEEAIHDRIMSLPNVSLFRGFTATDIEQDANAVTVGCQAWRKGQESSGPTSAEIRLTARYLVGADGSKSFVRQCIGVERTDFGFNERWLCVDTEPLRPLPSKFNDNAQQICDPRRGHMFMPIGRKRQRFEFALLHSETTESMQTPDAAYRLLKSYHGLQRDDVSLIRTLVYTFECRLAQSWKVGRVFLAGDAAHTNPPYLGQGACSGMRDGASLAWKFDLVLRGVAGDALLETYEAERRPHAQKLMLDSRALGLVANTSNPVKAAVRDLMFKLKLTPKPEFPILTAGVIVHGSDGKPAPNAGTLPPRGRLTVGGIPMRFDEYIGFNFSLVMRAGVAHAVSTSLRRPLEAVGVRFVELAGPGSTSDDRVVDTDGIYGRLLDSLNADAALLRPDFVLFGCAARANVTALANELLERLHSANPSRKTHEMEVA